jgi:tetratricopeptide (TPR) repeat protein
MEEPSLAPKGRDLTGWLKEQADIVERAEQSRLIVGPDQEFAESAKQLAVQGKKTQGAPGTTQPSLQTAKPFRSVVVTTLSGNGTDAFDLTMRSAQQFMNQGKFYDAYQAYANAGTLKTDPLAVYGQANALIAAGEFRSAGERLQVAMKMFPKFVHLTLDGSHLLGGKSILDRRLGQVRNLSIKNDDQDLLLLAGYMEILAGNHDAGLGLISHAGN